MPREKRQGEPRGSQGTERKRWNREDAKDAKKSKTKKRDERRTRGGGETLKGQQVPRPFLKIHRVQTAFFFLFRFPSRSLRLGG
ncbi:MAG: hypothetical protein DMG05_00215 [Acidobacteria bacterium]|nr:MAG: hypothetical protein DMG05_00215 [Acidobacteriota bacterium]